MRHLVLPATLSGLLGQLGLLGSLAVSLHAQVPIQVDAVRGNDTTGTGSSTSPYKTLTRAIAASNSLPVLRIFRLSPGLYDTALGEVFPIQLPALCTVEPDPNTTTKGALQVRFTDSLSINALFQVAAASVQKVTLRELRLSGGIFRGLQFTGTGATTTVDLQILDCDLSLSRPLVVQFLDGASGQVLVRNTILNGPDNPVILRTTGSAKMTARLESCRVQKGLATGIQLDAGGTSSLHLDCVNVIVQDQSKSGLLAWSQGGTITTKLDHCLFYNIANLTIGGSPGAILDSVTGTGRSPTHTIRNTIFDKCKNDAPGYASSTYAFQTCLVGQQSLKGVGGNILAAPSMANESKADFHLRQGSPGIGQGTVTTPATTVDIDGHPRAAKVTIGPHEFHQGLSWVSQVVSTNGARTLRFGAQGPSNSNVMMYVATGTANLGFVPGIHLSGLILPAFGSTTDATGMMQHLFTITTQMAPAAPVGTQVWLQPLFLLPPHLGPNAVHLVIRER